MLKIFSATFLGNKIHVNVDDLNLLAKKKLSSRLITWLFMTQDHDVHSNHIDGASNLLSDTLSRMPHLDDIEACSCDNETPCDFFCFAMDNEALASKKPFALDLLKIAGTKLNDPYCAPIVNTINNHKNFNCKIMSLHDNNAAIRTSDNKLVVPLCL